MVVSQKRMWFLARMGVASLVIFVLFSYLLGKILVQDISLEPISSRVSPDFQAKHYAPRSVVYLISYADGPEVYFKNQNALAASALNKGIDFILNYRRSHLDPHFVKHYATILNQKKGAGFWLWKPWIILKTLETARENDIIIYADTGILFRKPITPLIELAKQRDIILLEYDIAEYWGRPINITKREIFMELDCDTDKCHYGRHLWAGMLVLRNTQKSRDFIKKWLKYCCDERLIMDDLDPKVDQYPEFVRQYHDEAILNVLYNVDPSQKHLFPARELFDKYATWHHRYFKTEDHSLLMANHYNRASMAYITQSDILNNYLAILFRKIQRTLFHSDE